MKYASIDRWDNTRFLISFNPQPSAHDEGAEEYADSLIIPGINKGVIIDALVRREYTLAQELSILRQRATKPDEFMNYNRRVEELKGIASAILAAINHDE